MRRRLISGKTITIQIVRRTLGTPAPGSAAPVHTYSEVFTVRAQVKTSGGVSEFAAVDINGTRVTHTFTIRWTSIPFDTRDRVRDVEGNLFRILQVDNIDDNNEEIAIRCANVGNEDREAAR